MKEPKLKSIEWDGRPISKPGLYSKLSMKVYHGRGICVGPAVSSGGLRLIRSKSPAHFYSRWPENPKRIERPETRALILGRASHHLFLGELYFSKFYVEQPAEYISEAGEVKKWTYAAHVCKRWRDDQERAGRSILTGEDIEAIRGMAESLGNDSFIQAGILRGLIERSIVWFDKATGLWCKARPDAIPTDSGDFADLKTTASVLFWDLQTTIFEYGYYQQAAWIRTGAREVLGFDNITFTLVFAESAPPYCVRTVTLKDADLDRGEKENRKALETIARCLKANEWPGPGGTGGGAQPIDLPEWAQKRIDERLKVDWS